MEEISIGKEFGTVTFGALRNEIQPFNIILMEILSIYVSCYDCIFLEHRRTGLLGEAVTEQAILRQGLGG